MVNASAESLAGPEWDEFFAFVEREARPTLERLGDSVGNIAKGVAEMWMAFDPLSDDFQDGLVDATERFEAWAERLGETDANHRVTCIDRMEFDGFHVLLPMVLTEPIA